MDASKLPKGQSKENSPVRHLPGTYVHKDTGAKFITSEGEEGYIQADALHSPNWLGRWERVGDVPTRLELQEMRRAQEVQDLEEQPKEVVGASKAK